MSDIESKHITIRSGLAFSYVEQGDPRGTPVVLLHGYTDSWRSWAPFMAHLPPRFRVIALTQRGHGDSDKPEGAYRLADFAADLGGVLDALEIDRAVIAGHSMGSLVATRFAIDRAARVSGLALIGAFTTLKGNAGGEELWRDAVARLVDPLDAGFVRSFQESTLARPVPTAFLDGIVAESLKVPARVWRAALAAMLDDDFSPALPLIAAPALIVWGDHDDFTGRAEQEALKIALRDATLMVHPRSGHAPHWEDPARVAREIASFIDARVATAAPANQFAARAAAGG